MTASDGTQLKAPAETPRTGARLAPLDGIRAFAVLTVILYHFGVSWTTGGLLGVDVFFVLSGFLITSLLCQEFGRTGGIALKRFWGRRARRLLPALFVLLLGVALYARVFASTVDLSSVRGDALATLAYVANWHFILSDQGYFAQVAAPSPLLHMWSLGVEEQYYLVWPLIALFVLRRWGRQTLCRVAGVGALASAGLMAAMHASGFSVDRLYYGTDTRAQALLVGSFLGAAAAGRDWRGLPASVVRSPRLVVAWGVLCAGSVVYLLWAWHAFDGQLPFLYEGGFLLVAIATAVVIATVTTWPHSLLARFLSVGVLTYIGRISYGLYLYHWPIFLAVNHAHTGLQGLALLTVRLLITFAVAIISFTFLEQPIRRGSFFRSYRGSVAVGIGALATTAALVGATTVPALAIAGRGAGSMPASERDQLTAARAFTTDPVRFLLLGDSLALTLGMGLSYHSQRRFGVAENDQGSLGCDLDPNTKIQFDGVVQPATQGCPDWRAGWPALLRAYRPEVVGLLVGRWEVFNHFYKGRWVHIGEPAWDAHLLAEMNQAVQLLSSRGARVALFDDPMVDPPEEAPNGSAYPENDPARVVMFNKLVEQVAHENPTTVTLIDLDQMLDPDGHYTPTLDGLTVRTPDGVHISIPGGELVQSKVLPTIAALGLLDRPRPAS